MPWDDGKPLAMGQTFVLSPAGGRREGIEAARAAGLLDVDLGRDWAPFIFSESDPGDDEAKVNAYRKTFIALANDQVGPDELLLDTPAGQAALLAASPAVEAARRRDPSSTVEESRALDRARRFLRGEKPHNYLEPLGIPPTLSVLLTRVEDDAKKSCYDTADRRPLAQFHGEVSYQSREQARNDHAQAASDAQWVDKLLLARPDDGAPPTLDLLAADPKLKARIERYRRGRDRVQAIRAAQQRLQCEGLLSPRSRYSDGTFDLPTHEALAEWEQKNDIFGWGILGGETLTALLRPPMDLHLETFKRIVTERVADGAGIIEDGSVGRGSKNPPTYRDAQGVRRPVPNVIGDHVEALMGALDIARPDQLARFLRTLGPAGLATLHVAFAPPPLPEYYGRQMDLLAEIDRGDVWYDFPWDKKGKPVVQRREHYPHLTMYVRWQGQKIPLARWRTTIGSWRSELHPDGHVYYKYKNSDVGPRIWKNIVTAPVWIPPDGTPGKDLLTKKVLDRNIGALTVVNTEVMGPGFGSAYGLVMAIHLQQQGGGGLFDNQIRTHGSVDYTSIARRFSHGCHRLVNNRAVRLFGFVLRRRTFERLGDQALHHLKKHITTDDKDYPYELTTRGYYYELRPPVPVVVLEGRIMGAVKKPVTAYVRKPGVDYGPDTDADEVETAPVVGP